MYSMKTPNVLGGHYEKLARECRQIFRNSLERASLDDGVIGVLRSLHTKTGHTVRCTMGMLPQAAYPLFLSFLLFAAPLQKTSPATFLWTAPAILLAALMIAWAAEAAQYFLAH